MNAFDWLAIAMALAAFLAGAWMWLGGDDDFEAALQSKPVHVRLQCRWLKKRLDRIAIHKAELASEQHHCDAGYAETSAALRGLGWEARQSGDVILGGVVGLKVLAEVCQDQHKALTDLLAAISDDDCMADVSPAVERALAAAKSVVEDWSDAIADQRIDASVKRLEAYRMLVLDHIEVTQLSLRDLIKAN